MNNIIGNISYFANLLGSNFGLKLPILIKSGVLAVVASFGLSATSYALTIKPTYDSSVTGSAFAGQIESAFSAAAAVFQTAFTNPVTVNINVGWGEVGGVAISSLGASGTGWYGFYTASQMAAYLKASATSANDQLAYSHLRTSAPTGTSGFWIAPAQAKALGIISGTSTAIDGYVGFGSGYGYTFNDAAGVASGTYDFMGVAEHEISEVLGRQSGLGPAGSNPAPSVLDEFRCSGGAPSFTYGAASYLSIDGCATSLVNFNAASGADSGDWASSTAPTDAFDAYATASYTAGMTATDIVLMDVLGWNTLPSSSGTGGTTGGTGGTTGGNKGHHHADVDEPPMLSIVGIGLVALGLARRRVAGLAK